jgi:response regulator NasT
VAADKDPARCRFYRAALARLGHQIHVAETGQQLIEQCRLRRPDLVLLAALPDLDPVASAEEVGRERPTPIILTGGDHDSEWVDRVLLNPHVVAYLHEPVKEADLGPAVLMARNQFERLQSLCREVTDLRQKLEDRKLIERAKGVVMRRAEVDEAEAFRRLTKLASTRNLKLAVVAQRVLISEEVLLLPEQKPAFETAHARSSARPATTYHGLCNRDRVLSGECKHSAFYSALRPVPRVAIIHNAQGPEAQTSEADSS